MTRPSILALGETLERPDERDPASLMIGVRPDSGFTLKLVNLALGAFFDGWRVYGSWTGTELADVDPLITRLNEIAVQLPDLG